MKERSTPIDPSILFEVDLSVSTLAKALTLTGISAAIYASYKEGKRKTHDKKVEKKIIAGAKLAIKTATKINNLAVHHDKPHLSKKAIEYISRYQDMIVNQLKKLSK